MRYFPTFSVALRGILANKLRSFLTILGVIIGIGSIISMMAVGEGSERSVTGDFERMGSNLLFVQPGAGWMGMLRGAQGTVRTLTYDDAVAMTENLDTDAVRYVVPEAGTTAQVFAVGENVSARISGVGPEFDETRNKIIADGQFISQADVDNKATVCVLGSKLAQDLFDDADPLGERVRVKGRGFTVVGVLEADGEMFMTSTDRVLLVPVTTMLYRINPQYSTQGDHLVDAITVEATSEGEVDQAVDQVTAFLRERHGLAADEEDDFSITNQQEIIDMQTETSDTLKTLLKWTSIMSLLIAGIGIMNIMLVSVTERTREIGIRKAVGAKRRHVLVQFLLEAATISLIGGVIGIGFGYVAAEHFFTGLEMNQNMMMEQSPVEPVVTVGYVLWAFLVAVGVGIISGMYPAMRAARLNPIDALRYE